MKPSEMTKEQLDGRITRTAWNFAAKIVEVHTEEEFKAIVEANAAEADPNICHSHDFCDANDLMMVAFCEAFGQTEEEFDLQDEGVIDAINAAWALAKAANFTFSEE